MKKKTQKKKEQKDTFLVRCMKAWESGSTKS